MTTGPEPRKEATYADLLALPENVIGEIVDGELVVSPRPDAPHAKAASDLGVLLGSPFRMGVGGPGGWVLLFEPRIRFGRDVRVPDLAGWRKERFVDMPRRGPIGIVPDWICEVLSPSTEAIDRGEKRALYGRFEVPHLWLVGPASRTLEVFRWTPDGWLVISVHTGEAKIRAEPFDAVELELGQLWLPREPDEPDEGDEPEDG